MFAGKPIIGIAGGIGSGKSFVARLFAELGCAVIDSDAQVRAAYQDPAVRKTLREWWGDEPFLPDGSIHRAAIARRIFANPQDRARLEGLLHPMVNEFRKREMEKMASDSGIVAFVWDTPLLFEAGLHGECDAVVYVEAPLEVRRQRVWQTRKWDATELLRRENSQWPLDRKREISDYVVENTADAGFVRDQVRAVLSRILERASHRPDPE
ncbi:MAG TPA: dephospho-CoA kinase [Tepidisphaeraceae bacterium]|nr:dephospho-CoA kinase [Tepidisphaeraceae bacterium]